MPGAPGWGGDCTAARRLSAAEALAAGLDARAAVLLGGEIRRHAGADATAASIALAGIDAATAVVVMALAAASIAVALAAAAAITATTAGTAAAVVRAANGISGLRREGADRVAASARQIDKLFRDLSQMKLAKRQRVVGLGTRLAAASYSGGIWTSTDGGLSWTQTSAPTTVWQSLASSANGTLLAAGGNSGVWISTNGGMTWTQSSLTT